MPRLIFREGKSRKFWHAWVEGLELTVRFGKLGSDGQEQRKTFDSNAAADKELAKLVKQKLAKGYADETFRQTFEESGLALRGLDDPPLPVPDDASAAYRDVSLPPGSWSGAFWHDDFTFGLAKQGDAWVAGILGRANGEMHWREVEPKITGSSFPFAFAGGHVIVATSQGAAFVVECASAKAKEIASAGDEIIAAALTRDHAALLRKKNGATRLDLHALADGNLAHTIDCGRQNLLHAFGGGRLLMVGWKKQNDSWDGKNWPTTHFVGVDGEPRLLGTTGLDSSYAFEQAGRSFFANDAQGLLEIENLDAALAKGKPITRLA